MFASLLAIVALYLIFTYILPSLTSLAWQETHCRILWYLVMGYLGALFVILFYLAFLM